MGHRLYFVLGDLFANILAGVVAGLLCWLLVEPSWWMVAAMVAMMGAGRAVGAPGAQARR